MLPALPGFLPAGGMGQNFSPAGSVATDRSSPWQAGKLFFVNFGNHLNGVPLRVKGPALIDYQGFGIAGGNYVPGAMHRLRFFAVPSPANTPGITTNVRVRVPLVNQGPYIFLPQGGDYVVFMDDVVDSNIVGLPNADTAGWFFTVTENYSAEMARIIMAQPPRVVSVVSTTHSAINGASTHLLPPSPSGNYGEQQDGHVCGIIIQNNSPTVRSVYLAIGRDALVTDFELPPLSISQGLNLFQPGWLGCGDSVNVFNSFATPISVNVFWLFQ